jgi:hypothetical protein
LVNVALGSSTALLAAGVCVVVTGFGVDGTAAPVNTSALATWATTHAPVEGIPAKLAPQVPSDAATLLRAPPVPRYCTASPRNATPNQNGNATIIVRTTRGANADLKVHYPTTTRSFTIVADSAGTAVVTFPISRSIPGSPVQVDVSTNSGQICSTQFTPR